MILDILFPKWCLVCGKIGTYVCIRCRGKFEYVEKDGCLYCDKITFSGQTHEQCQRKHGVDGILSLVYYSSEMKRVMKELKYGFVRDAYHELFWSLRAEIVAKLAFYQKYREDMYIQPLPLHKRRLEARGFNQSLVLAELIAKVTNIPLISALDRVKDTPQQARQGSKWQRFLNIRNAFAVPNPTMLRGKSIIILDDVITSGSTIKEAARCLKRAGAKRVFALSLLRD